MSSEPINIKFLRLFPVPIGLALIFLALSVPVFGTYDVVLTNVRIECSGCSNSQMEDAAHDFAKSQLCSYPIDDRVLVASIFKGSSKVLSFTAYKKTSSTYKFTHRLIIRESNGDNDVQLNAVEQGEVNLSCSSDPPPGGGWLDPRDCRGGNTQCF